MGFGNFVSPGKSLNPLAHTHTHTQTNISKMCVGGGPLRSASEASPCGALYVLAGELKSDPNYARK